MGIWGYRFISQQGETFYQGRRETLSISMISKSIYFTNDIQQNLLYLVYSTVNDSALNSLEYWDYSVELECLTGPEGAQTTFVEV